MGSFRMSKTLTHHVIITGASSGIGREVAIHLAERGHYVLAVARRGELLESLRANFPEHIRVVVADIATSTGREKILNAVKETQQLRWYLINNAAVANPALLADMTEKHWDDHFNINVKAVVFLVKLLRFYLVEGRILSISTGLAHSSMQGLMAYGASKAALLAVTDCLSLELENDRIKCASLLTGIVDTPMQERLRNYSKEIFPKTVIFKEFAETKSLYSPTVVAEFIIRVLLDSDDEEFVQEWERV